MHLTPLNVAPFVPTEKKPGDRILTSHRCHVIADNGGIAEDTPADYHDDPLYASQKRLPWRVLSAMGITLAATFLWAIGAVPLFLFGVVVVPLCALLIAWRGGAL